MTSVFAANTKEWKESSTGIDSWGNTVTTEHLRKAHTSLGMKLKLPDEPAEPTHPGLWHGIGGLVAFILASTLCLVALVPLSFIIPLITMLAICQSALGAIVLLHEGRDGFHPCREQGHQSGRHGEVFVRPDVQELLA